MTEKAYSADEYYIEVERRFAASGTPIVRDHSANRARIYRLGRGETVRIRSTNSRCLVCRCDDEEMLGVLDIEGTDWLVIAMPEKIGSRRGIEVYNVPTLTAAATVRACHYA